MDERVLPKIMRAQDQITISIYIGSIAENFEAVQDYFDSTSIIGARSLGDIGGIERSSLPPGVNLQDFVSGLDVKKTQLFDNENFLFIFGVRNFICLRISGSGTRGFKFYMTSKKNIFILIFIKRAQILNVISRIL